jgi:glutaredoxin
MNYKVELFTTTDCGNCKIAKMILEQYGIDFIERNIELSKTFENELMLKTNGQKYVPTIVVNDNVYPNIKPHELLELVKLLKQKSDE